MSAFCLSTLSPLNTEGYSPSGQRQLSGGQRMFPAKLTFSRADVVDFQAEASEHMSISGVQDKISLHLHRGRLSPVESGGEYILKPVPSSIIPRFKADVPANEHLTMQIASQVFGIQAAVNACIRFADGELAYITKRFDLEDGKKIAQEDLCQLSERTEASAGRNYKYDGTCEEVGRLLRKYCGAYAVEAEKLFRLLVFNYAFSNGDAHLKNFSLRRSPLGDYVLSPAYDLLATSMHFPNEGRTALELFDSLETDSFLRNGFYRRPDFLELAGMYGIGLDRASSFIDRISSESDSVEELVKRSFLSPEAKDDYLRRFIDRTKALE